MILEALYGHCRMQTHVSFKGFSCKKISIHVKLGNQLSGIVSLKPSMFSNLYNISLER